MIRATLALSLLVAFTMGLAVTPAASAAPDPIDFYPCFAGGTSIVVMGRTVATCFLGPGGSPVGYTYCGDGGRAYTVLMFQTTCVGG